MRSFVVLLMVLAGFLTACGGDEDAGTTTTTEATAAAGEAADPDVAAGAVEAMAGVGSAKIEGSTSQAGQEISSYEGEFNISTGEGRITSTAAGADFEMVFTPEASYVRVPSLPGVGDDWIRFGTEGGDPGIPGLGAVPSSPSEGLAPLAAEGANLERLGTEEVRGVQTTHYRVTGQQGGSDSQELWIDDEGLVRKVVIESGNTVSTFEMFDFGAPVEIQVPTEDQVTSLDNLLQLPDNLPSIPENLPDLGQ